MKLRSGITSALFIIISSTFFFSCAENDVVEDLVTDKEEEYLSLSPSDRILVDAGAVWIDKLCSREFEGRKSGTEGNRLAFEYISHELMEMGYSPEYQIFNTENGTTIRNIIVTIPGSTDSTVIVGAHFDGPIQSTRSEHYPAAEDNGAGAVEILMLLKSISMEPLYSERTLTCCFWDSEEVNEDIAFRGSSYYANQLSDSLKSLIIFYTNFDGIGHDHDYDNNGVYDIYLEYLGSEYVKRLAFSIAGNGRFDYIVSQRETFISDFASFYRIGIPFITYHDHSGYKCKHYGHTTSDTKDAISLCRLAKIVYNVRESLGFLL